MHVVPVGQYGIPPVEMVQLILGHPAIRIDPVQHVPGVVVHHSQGPHHPQTLRLGVVDPLGALVEGKVHHPLTNLKM